MKRINLSKFKTQIDPVILSRGRGYFLQGKVKSADNPINGVHEFRVRGRDMYEVQITTDGDAVTGYSCDCPYGGTVCKHVAACLFYMDQEARADAEVEKHLFDVPEDASAASGNVLGLSDTELYYLCYLVYSGEDADGRHTGIPAPRNIMRLTGRIQRELGDSLFRKGWLEESPSYYSNCYRPARSRYYDIATELITNRQAWLAMMKQAVHQKPEAVWLFQTAMLLNGAKPKSCPEITDDTTILYNQPSGYGMDVLSECFSLEHAEKVVPIISQYLLQFAADRLIGKMQDGSTEAMEILSAMFANVKFYDDALLRYHSIFSRDVFYMTGQKPDTIPGESSFAPAYYILATECLYSGKIDESIDFFKKGITVQNKLMKVKGLPQDGISLMLYSVALAMRHSEDDMSSLKTILGKQKSLYGRLDANFILIDFLIDNSHNTGRGLEHCLMHRNTSSAIAWLTSRLMRHTPEIGNAGNTPFAILRREMSAFISEMDSGKWPYEPVLPKLKIREPWEQKLEDLIGSAESANVEATSGIPDERLFYVCEDCRDTVEVRLQNRLKSGAWGKGKSLSMIRYTTCDCPMDDIDKAIYAEWRKSAAERRYYSDSFPRLLDVAPSCKGTDRLYVRRGYNDYEPVTVVEDIPYLMTERKDGFISFKTNIPNSAWKYDCKFPYCWQPGNRLVLYNMPTTQLGMLHQILELGKVPEMAEPMLERLFKAVNGKIEIQSDISGAVQMERMDGNPLLVLRIRPEGKQFRLTASVSPLEGSDRIFEPGIGAETVVCGRDGKHYEVVRDLKSERRNLKRLVELLRGNTCISDNPAEPGGAVASVRDVIEILEAAPEHSDEFCVEWPEGKSINIRQANPEQWHISAEGKGGWLDIEGEFQLSEDTVITVSQLLEMIRQDRSTYLRLSDDEFLHISIGLRRQLERIDAVAESWRGKLRIPELAMTVMGDALKEGIDIDEPAKIAKLRQRIREAGRMSFAVPDSLNAVLRDYQTDGYEWMMRLAHWGAGACLADDMGLGKTVQSIAFMLAHASEGPQLVAAPASVVSNWYDEIVRFAPTMKVTLLNDCTTADRNDVIGGLSEGCILLTSYGLLVSEQESICEREWTTVVLDEAHTIKNRETKTSAAVMKLKSGHRIILTGTPVQNHLGELWNLFRFVNPGLLGSYEHFTQTFLNPINTGDVIARDSLKRLVAPFMLRRTKQEVVRELPDKTEITLPVMMSESEMAVYEVMRREAKDELENSSAVSVNALAMITRLRMAACSASLVEKEWTGECSKLDVLTDKIHAIIEGGNSVLVFSQFTSFLEMAKKRLDECGLKDYLYLDGSTPLPKRRKMVTQFQNGEHRLFLISLKAGGLGLNLTGANYVIHLDPWWNPAIEQQATDRAYRIGQRQNVTVYHLIARNTIEEKILRLHESKRSLADSILEGTDASNRLSTEELLKLLDTV